MTLAIRCQVSLDFVYSREVASLLFIRESLPSLFTQNFACFLNSSVLRTILFYFGERFAVVEYNICDIRLVIISAVF